MSEHKKNPTAQAKRAGELAPRSSSATMMTVIVSEIRMAPVAEQYPVTVAIDEMADYYGVDQNEGAVVRAMNSECNRQFRPTKNGGLMRAEIAPPDWDGDMDKLPTPEWATDDDELERLAGAGLQGPVVLRRREIAG